MVTINPSQVVTRKLRAKLYSKRNNRGETETSGVHSENKVTDHSTERVIGAELRNSSRCRQLGHMARECLNPAPKEPKNFFLPGDAFAQLHNLSYYMLYDGASKTVVGCNYEASGVHWFRFGISSWLDGQWSTATCGGGLNCFSMVRSTSQAAQFGARGRDTVQHDRDVWEGHGQSREVPDFFAGIVGVNGVMPFMLFDEPMSADGKQFIPPLTPITIMRELIYISMKDSSDVLKIGDGQGLIYTEKLARERAQSGGLFFERRMEIVKQPARPSQA